eukprot:CAMPEP_0171800382 /NCGR_PEP_ID=MMETSP0991-20121206/71645_1 /TAXON_ID=483369 /ORGANISM="non described non described, Strain CCMP2098" /LENGTH=34 /DNA_ID= /DNA_START= /DNA_END= /DNA_ORIENTATION=
MTDEVLHEGWLSKKGHFRASWKKRYFVLEARGHG